jgi:plasmid maintenance system killer protein
MIKTFACKETEALWSRKRSRLPADIASRAYDKLMLLNFAADVEFLRSPPSHPNNFREGAMANTAFESTSVGGFALHGTPKVPTLMMSK